MRFQERSNVEKSHVLTQRVKLIPRNALVSTNLAAVAQKNIFVVSQIKNVNFENSDPFLIFIINVEEEEIEALAQCKYDGEIYLEGEKFYPEKEKCHSCICKANFDTSTIRDNPNCREIDCGIELRYFQELRNGCIPVYYEDRCCPTDWKCRKFSNLYVYFHGREWCNIHIGITLTTLSECGITL